MFSGMSSCSIISKKQDVSLIAQTDIGIRFEDVMRDMKKYLSKVIANELEKDKRKLFLYVFKQAAE